MNLLKDVLAHIIRIVTAVTSLLGPHRVVQGTGLCKVALGAQKYVLRPLGVFHALLDAQWSVFVCSRSNGAGLPEAVEALWRFEDFRK